MQLFFLQSNERVAQLSGLAFDLLFEPFETWGISGSPDGFAVFELFGNMAWKITAILYAVAVVAALGPSLAFMRRR